jgi:succinate dehydrogenase / fumarate reductase cytochrome b subunit
MAARGALALWDTTVGKKAVMAATGLLLVGFVVSHMLGNLKIYLPPHAPDVPGAAAVMPLDEYGAFLRTAGAPLLPKGVGLWIARLALLGAAALHITAATQLTLRNRAARPVPYATKTSLSSTYAARTMRYGGVILLLFVVYHVLHLTLGRVGFDEGAFEEGRVHANVVHAFRSAPVVAFYVLAQVALCLHLFHGVWSMFQTLGVDTKRACLLRGVAAGLAATVAVGNISIPVAVLAGWVK